MRIPDVARIGGPSPGAQRAHWLLTYSPASFAGLQVLLSAVTTGGLLIAKRRLSVSNLAKAALEHRATHISATPTFLRSFLVAAGDRSSCLPLVQATLGGETADASTIDMIRGRFPNSGLTHIYASTEVGAAFGVKDGRSGFPAAWLDTGVEDVRVRIRDGGLEVVSPRAMKGYLQRPSEVGDGGWIRTGDLVTISGDRVEFIGRSDSVINVGGGKVMPEEVERVLMNVSTIQDARVFGVKNPISGSLVAAEVVAIPGADPRQVREAIMTSARAELPPYKVPRRIRVVDSLSINAAGKKSRS